MEKPRSSILSQTCLYSSSMALGFFSHNGISAFVASLCDEIRFSNLRSDSVNAKPLTPWLIVLPGLTVVVIALGFSFVGDGLRDVLDAPLRR